MWHSQPPRLLDLTQPIEPTMPVYETHLRPAVLPWTTMVAGATGSPVRAVAIIDG